MFQSYLYGIEIQYDCDGKTATTMFQSYLYGIEIRNIHVTSTAAGGFNRTFMELKSTSTSDY